ncbi:hypothetical protein Vadar_023541 [Vaccinium darrowii]|uniref:Uncharacterized protein n=1 Tax=Vaccinium darrowii TaxID=229202 RepID=A0ACB7XBT1_9ERIC|nr:hypothetical protein Vadar_023541 [Vaccinium darrowii]
MVVGDWPSERTSSSRDGGVGVYTIGIVGYSDDQYTTTILELKYNFGVTEYTKGHAYFQVAIATDDVYKSAEAVKIVAQELGGKIIRRPGPISPGIGTKMVSFLDQDGWKIVLGDNKYFLKELNE